MKELSSIFPKSSEYGIDLKNFDLEKLPTSVAIIMDGNGRWAKKKAQNRLFGHKAGIEAVREAITISSDLGIKYLTIYSFSTENWNRSKPEVDGLMNLFAKTMLAEVDGLNKNNARVVTIGNLSKLPKDTKNAFDKAYNLTKNNTGLTLVVAINYGSRDEIKNAFLNMYKDIKENKLNIDDIEQSTISNYLYTKGIPDPDLIIRTSGEMRLSNFLLWQAAYSEFVVSNTLWPDFNRYEYLSCLIEFQGRNRRFGIA